LASELISELSLIDRKIKATNAQLRELIAATGSGLLDLNGIGPSGAARLLGDIGDIACFPDHGHFASWNGTAPIDASSGEQHRHRLSRAGNRRINRVLHIMAIVRLRNDTDGRAYYRRKVAAGKTRMEALRCLKRRLSDVVYRQLVADAREAATSGDDGIEAQAAGPEGHMGRLQNPARPTSTPSSALRRSHSRTRQQRPYARPTQTHRSVLQAGARPLSRRVDRRCVRGSTIGLECGRRPVVASSAVAWRLAGSPVERRGGSSRRRRFIGSGGHDIPHAAQERDSGTDRRSFR
jgi:Transposase IS116/IS110/IS902 family